VLSGAAVLLAACSDANRPPASPTPRLSASTATQPGQPQITLTGTDASGANFHVTWTASIDQATNQPVGNYTLDYGFEDASWQSSSSTQTNSADVHFPYASSTAANAAWLCVTPIDGLGSPGPHACKGFTVPVAPSGGLLADNYPCDQGIGSDPAVVWYENFEEGSVSGVTSRYNDYNNPAGMALVADRPSGPSGQCGTASMQMTAGGGSSTTDLYKKLLQGNGAGYDELYVRWYAKYQAGGDWHHTGVWFGGYNPPLDWANPQAGTKPNGNDRVSFAMEPVWGIGAPNPEFDFYDYWMTMHTCSNCNGRYWGNSLISKSTFIAPDNSWACVEVHAKLNTDMSSGAGAVLEVWKNDALIQTFPETGEPSQHGYWVQDHFCPVGANMSQCTDFSATDPSALDRQFRNSTALQLNWFWPQNFSDGPTPGSVWFDDMIVATTRIGCLR